MATLVGKKVVIVGGSSGIGFGVAASAVERGAEVVLVSRSRHKLQAAERKVSTADRRVRTVASDMTQEADISRLFDDLGAFDHLVSTAGGPPPGAPIADTDRDLVRHFIDDKLIGAFMLAKHAVRTLRRGGSMTFTSGINKDRPPVPGGAVVSAIAGSFSYMARALSLELAPTRVNVVSPGWVDTPLFNELAGEAKLSLLESLAARLPAGRVAASADIAPAYIFAMESEFTTGQTIHIDGGQSLL
jgi:NAD(P)-dependent dehydrogenase (short-subunit alcohol dehydrogenase family)